MKENFHFELTAFMDDEFNMRVPENEDYGYWLLLTDRFLKTANQIEIHCWNEEFEAMEGLESHLQKQEEGLYTVFSGEMSPALNQLLTEEYLDSKGRFKWFSIFLSSNGTTAFTAEHWATEFFVPDISKETELYIRKIMPADTSFHLYADKV
ncbi:hypothetical protein [Planococcus sp. NCCP-2050]|uniref:hypothetical protein n=1 Tax=Planococcus sp. NCCP-2050 TaxID=2944679 RepID=UPI00203E7309|nr:hypothetical protein [Planococcus sp. NCCP-2050]GKW46527.1 hypothetical protein NCCP2050_22190 [Planococcus sp. NCCP-2050]